MMKCMPSPDVSPLICMVAYLYNISGHFSKISLKTCRNTEKSFTARAGLQRNCINAGVGSSNQDLLSFLFQTEVRG